MKLFAQLTKVNAVTGMIYGRMAEELPDSSGEILDYQSSKPNFQKWSEEFAQATGGLSKGNVRAMHGKVAAGKLTEISFLDDEKAIDFVAKIIDPLELEKCIEGVYTGVSIGGSYAKRWKDGNLMRYTALPKEVSLADNPCLKTARFTLVKADGAEVEMGFSEMRLQKDDGADGFKSEEERKAAFANMADADKGSDKAKEATQKANGKSAEAAADGGYSAHAEAANAHNQAMKVHAKEGNEKAASYHKEARNFHHAEATKALVAAKVEIARCEGALAKIAAREDVKPEEGKEKYGDVKFADETNKKYPIDTEKHIRAAWNYINKGKNAAKYSAADLKSIKGKIVAAWKAKIDKEGPPSAEKMAKRMWTVADFAQMLQQLTYLASSLDWEAATEMDDSPLPGQFKEWLSQGAEIFKAMAEEEIDELLAMLAGEVPMQMLAKAGARHSASDKEKIQDIHNHSVALGADCTAAEKSEVSEMQKAEVEQLIEERLGKVEKAHAEAIEKMEKAHTEAMTKKDEDIAGLKADLEKILANTPKPDSIKLRVVGKAEDLGQDDPAAKVESIKKADGSIDHDATAKEKMKVALANPFIIGRQ